MDAASALGLASAILSVIDFGSKLVTGTREIYQSADGVRAFILEADLAQEELSRVSQRLSLIPADAGLSADEKALKTLAERSTELCRDFKRVLGQLKLEHPHRKFDSLKKAVRTMWNEKAIKEYSSRLGNLRAQLSLALLNVLSNAQSRLRNDILKAIHNMRGEITSTFNGLIAEFPSLTQANEDLRKDIAILDSLHYTAMSRRHQTITLAEKETFEWAFASRDDRKSPGPGFLEWLQAASGFFWIRGKPGSGKSTLMKFLHDDERTYLALRRWAGSKRLVTAHHYFWGAGTELQKSQEGLLQSLLYDIFRHAPILMRELCPGRWQSTSLHAQFDVWTRRELYDTLSQLHKTLSLAEAFMFCFFIDGLDEYDGDHLELVDLIKGLAPAKNIKICVSSRPWQEFVDAFAATATPCLRLEALTASDMSTYINAKFMEVPSFAHLSAEDNRYSGLVQEITNRASGVFLWVFLVVRTMRRGFVYSDTIDDCQRRLDTLPTDLDAFFRVMLDSVEATYHEEAARILQICCAATEPQLLFTLSFFADPDFLAAFEDMDRLLREMEIEKHCDKGQLRIEVRCRDLLEVVDNVEHFSRLSLRVPLRRVEFMHRTVRDYLMSPEVQLMLENRVITPFNPNTYLARSYLMRIKSLDLASHENELCGLLGQLMSHERAAERIANLPDSATLDHLEVYGFPDQTYIKQFWGHKLGFQEETLSYGWVLAIALQSGCDLYVSDRLERDPQLRHGIHKRPLLDFCLTLPFQDSETVSRIEQDPRMIKMLLGRGLSPNDYYDGETVCARFLARLLLDKEKAPQTTKRIWASILFELRQHGAIAAAGSPESSNPELLLKMLEGVILPVDILRFRQLLQSGTNSEHGDEANVAVSSSHKHRATQSQDSTSSASSYSPRRNRLARFFTRQSPPIPDASRRRAGDL